jgi:hypothetical protein
MGEYNPHTPYILGQEWVGIRDELLAFEPTVNTAEQGHRFTLGTSSQVNHGRVYVDEVGPGGGAGAVVAISIYPAGLGDESGPIRSVDIPLTSVTVSGDTATAISTTQIVGAPTALGALYAQGGDSYISWPGTNTDFRWISCLFDIGKFAGFVKDKRILNIQLLYTADCSDGQIDPDPDQNFGTANSIGNTFIYWTPNPHIFLNNGPFLGRMLARPDDGYVLDMGELNFHFSGQAPTPNLNQVPDRMNFSWAELARMAGLASPFVYVMLGTGNLVTTSDFIRLQYVALRITYCEEQRVAYGATAMGTNFANAYGKIVVPGAFIVNVRSPTTMGTNPVLAAGTYDVVVSSANLPLPLQPVPGFPPINALRELYSMPAHTPVLTQIPFPLDSAIGDTFEQKTTTILPQLSLHTTGGTLTQPHAYGRQAVAQVYGAMTALQDIYDVPVGGAASFPQVRYYARRFGQTTQPLLLSTTSPTISGSTVSITPTAFDALDEIVDGWKDVTLRFTTPPIMGTGLIPKWMWSSVGETAPNRWEVLGVSSMAITATPANALTLVTSPNQTSTATYGQPISGSVVDLDWTPGLAPTVTGTTDDPSADAVLIFSQDPAMITGVVISLLSQAVTGFVECTRGPCCIPTAIQYNRVVWSPSTLPATGFGAYELQRRDPVEAVWETIMMATNIAVTGFNDYEARVGVISSYQIRQTNVLDFAGAWSVTGTSTVTEPGVTLPSCGTTKRGVLIFTSNEMQDGSRNLAYVMTWDDTVVEDFEFLEAGTVDIQRHHDRDFQVAFHGSERGGEQFSRRLLLANAAVALPRLGNMHSLRDLAWDDLPYVCVRDDIGDRWLSTIIVPHGDVRRRRRLYNADVTIIEVTDTPSPVDP